MCTVSSTLQSSAGVSQSSSCLLDPALSDSIRVEQHPHALIGLVSEALQQHMMPRQMLDMATRGK